MRCDFLAAKKQHQPIASHFILPLVLSRFEILETALFAVEETLAWALHQILAFGMASTTALPVQCANVQAEKDEAVRQAEQAKRERDQLAQQLEDFRQEIGPLRKEVEGRRTVEVGLRNQIGWLNGENEQLTKDYARKDLGHRIEMDWAKEGRKKWENIEAGLRSEIELLKTETEKRKTAEDELRVEMEKLKKSEEESKGKMEVSRTENEKLRSEAEVSRTEMERLRSEVERLSNEIGGKDKRMEKEKRYKRFFKDILDGMVQGMKRKRSESNSE